MPLRIIPLSLLEDFGGEGVELLIQKPHAVVRPLYSLPMAHEYAGSVETIATMKSVMVIIQLWGPWIGMIRAFWGFTQPT